MIAKIFKTFLGLCLLPIALGVGKAFYLEITELSIFSGALHILERGVLAYLLLHVFVIRPVYLYVLGHEAVHVLATWLCGGHVVSFSVTPSGGNVVTSKTNFFIELSPYFVPIYTLLTGVVFMLLRALNRESMALSAIFLFLVGLTMAFHFVMTAEILKLKQPDIMRSGIVFSFIIIFVLNLVVIMAVFCPIFDLSIIGFFKGSAANSGEIYRMVYGKAVQFVSTGDLW